MKNWLDQLLKAPVKKTMPVLSFPSVSLMGISVKQLISDSDIQAEGMRLVANEVPSSASVSMMDLSVEAEAFGASVKVSDDEVPTVVGASVTNMEEAEKLRVPEVGEGRTGLYVSAIEKACTQITDRPVFAGIIGPFSLAGRLMGVSDIMINCYEEPEMTHLVMRKVTEFIKAYAAAYKAAGANGVVMAEPLTGILSPALCAEFSEPYVKEIIDSVQDDEFIVIYHNCGNNTIQLIDSILRVGASAYHFGNAIDMSEMMTKIPENIIAMGNIDPATQFCNGTPESIKAETKRVMGECCKYPNFVISSGCDIPPKTLWKNIHAYFEAVEEFYADKA